MIDTIKATNLKGRTFGHKLGPITMIVGPNDAGKTAIADAVRLVLLGHIPGAPKSNKGIFTLCSATKLHVSATMDGAEYSREWTSKGEKVIYKDKIEGLPETPLVSMDGAEYFAASDAGKVDLIFSILTLDPEKWTIENVTAEIVAAVREVGDLPDLESILNTLRDPFQKPTVQTWLLMASEAVAEKAAEARATAARFEKTTQGIETLRMQDTPIDTERLAADLTAAADKLTALSEQFGRLQEVARAEKASQERARNLCASIATFQARIGDRPFSTENPEFLQVAINNLESERATLAAQYESAGKAHTKATAKQIRRGSLVTEIELKKKLAAEYGAAFARMRTLEEGINDADLPAIESLIRKTAGQADAATREAAALEGESKSIEAERQRLFKSYEALSREPKCPTCGAFGEQWSEEISTRYSEARMEIEGRNMDVEKRYASATAARTSAIEFHARAIGAEKKVQELQRALGEARTILQRSEHAKELLTSLENELAEIGEADPKAPERPKRLDEIAVELEQLRDEQQRLLAKEKIAVLQEELATIPAIDEQADKTLYRVECDIDATRERIEELKALEQKAQNQKADAKRVAEAQTEREAELVRVQLLKATAAAIKEKRELMVAAAMKPLLETVSMFTAGIIPTPLEFHDGEIGRFNGSSWVPVRNFGGCFTAVTYAGIQAALGMSAPARLVIVDEMGRFEEGNKLRFLENISNAIKAGKLNQFIGIDVSKKPYDDVVIIGQDGVVEKEGLTLITVGKS